jgi:predicted DNA-binding ribbon-helix-helix protein
MQTLVKPDPRHRAAYDDDLVLWIDGQIQLLVEARYSELDVENLVGELESMKNKETRQLSSRLRVLIMHLLKCEYQKSYSQNKWLSTLVEQRERIKRLLKDSPSLRRCLDEYIEESYPAAVKMAALETRLPASRFPSTCPYSVAQILDQDFTP